ncbi:MAG: winged helix-turn-helix domain-containing protein, partial [Tyzzerella sp.]|nr:winged helix-turn-helix domain-containing protein [Tyzzerella sp.]
LLLEALRAERRSDTYSDTIAQTIRVLSEIRKKPGITTAELAEIIERNAKTVRRYIATLNCAGEFIEYDRKKKGWFLYENKSMLWGDY